MPDQEQLTEPERARRTLAAGILVFRWGALAWMGALALTAATDFRRPWLAWTALALTLAWNVRVTIARGRLSDIDRWIDLGVGVGLMVVSALAVLPGEVVGPRPFFATMYPAAAALSWGAERGPVAGVGAGLVLSAGLGASRALNGMPLGSLGAPQVQNLANGIVYLLLAGGASGVISRLLDHSAEQLRVATEEALRERERSARYAERERLARQIHDSVLQALALVHKKGRDLAARGAAVSPDAVAALAATAGEQERALRELLLRAPEPPPAGRASLRDALEGVAREISNVPVSVSSVGALHLPAASVAEIAAAASQALANVEAHSGASRATVFADAADGWVHVSIRDDGTGFEFDPERLQIEGRGGLMKSVIGRIEDLGGSVEVRTAPGSGTEIEMRVPERAAAT